MNAPTGNFREDPDYAAGRALCLANGSLPIEASASLMRGYLDALAPRQLDGSKANGPGMREPFTARPQFIGPTNTPKPARPPKGNDNAILMGIPCLLSVVGRDGKLLRFQEIKRRYAQAIVDYCGGNLTMAARLLGERTSNIKRVLAKKQRRT